MLDMDNYKDTSSGDECTIEDIKGLIVVLENNNRAAPLGEDRYYYITTNRGKYTFVHRVKSKVPGGTKYKIVSIKPMYTEF